MKLRFTAVVCLLTALSGCTGRPEGIVPVANFELARYLGTWYEIARLDHSFERGLTEVSATYTLRDDGCIDVLNRGFDKADGSWREAKGKACFIGRSDIASLKVSFFGPFYGGYHVFHLDRDRYAYALVCGPDRSYLWILAREPELDQTLLDSLVRAAADAGFSTEGLIFVEHRKRSTATERGGVHEQNTKNS